MNQPLIWALTDDRVGNVNQVLGVAEALDLPFITKRIRYNILGLLPNVIRGKSLLGLDKKQSDFITEPWPDLVIGAGRKLAPISAYIKTQSQKTKIVHLMDPELPLRYFDLLAIPKHDHYPTTSFVMHTNGAPNRITSHVLEQAAQDWHEFFSRYQAPYIGLMIGGQTKHKEMTVFHAEAIAKKLNTQAKRLGASILITTSRRTPEHVIRKLTSMLKVPYYLYDFHAHEDNPYMGILALSSYLVVTGDSISMCSEACSTGRPVYIFTDEGLMRSKHFSFVHNLFDAGYAQPFNEKFEPKSYIPLLEATRIANTIARDLLSS